MKKQIALGALVMMLVSGIALAGGGDKHGHYRGGERLFDKLDANGDGFVTPEEIKQAQAARFERLDADGDGKVTVDELEAGLRQEAAERRFQRMDRNGDGVITENELSVVSEAYFTKLDKNGDGKISRDEIPGKWYGKHRDQGDQSKHSDQSEQ